MGYKLWGGALGAALLAVVLLVSACDTSGGPSGPGPEPEQPEVESSVVKFNLTGAAGLALLGNDLSGDSTGLVTASASRSNLVKVTADFEVHDVVTGGYIEAKEFFVLPYGVLIVPTVPVPVDEEDPEAVCGLVIVTPTSDAGCLDADVIEVWKVRVLEDAFFYVGRASSDGRQVIRRSSGLDTVTVWSELPSSPSRIEAFEAADDWSLYIAGHTSAEHGQVGWLRRITPAGTMEQLLSTSSLNRPRYLVRFPDRNIYFGNNRDGRSGMYRILTDTHTVDPLAWVGASSEAGYHYSMDEVGVYLGFPDVVPVTFASPAGVLGIARRMDDISFNGIFVFYPTPAELDVGIQALMLVERGEEGLILGGLNDMGRYRLVWHDFASPSVDILGDLEIEVHSAAYLDGVITFSGRRFSDAAQVVGRYEVASGQLEVEAGTLEIEGFQPLEF